MTDRHVPVEPLRAAIVAFLEEQRLTPEHAGFVADTLVETSLLGIDTHGVRLLPTYALELQGGRANPRPELRFDERLPAVAVLDADDALGVVAGNVAMRSTSARAAKLGIAATAVRNSNHFGAAGHYARIAARTDQIGLVFSNSDALVVPTNGKVPLNGTNPLAVAAPAAGEEFLLDMATSQTAYSRVKHFLANGLPLPRGWATDASGEDAAASRAVAALLPLGGYKGQGLGMMVQILTTVLTNLPFDAELSHLYEPPYDAPRRVGHFFVAIEIAAFAEVETFKRRLSELLARFRRSPPAVDGTNVIVPGDLERQSRERRLQTGIPLGQAELAVLQPFLQ